MANRIPLEERFWEKLDKGDPEKCWLWKGAPGGHGYGEIREDQETCHRAHVLAYKLMVGKIPKNLHVLHTCDVRLCCNPNHLFLGTNYDNVKDKVSKGRQAVLKGFDNGQTKLSLTQVKQIHELKGKITAKECGKLFDVTGQYIGQIWRKEKRQN